MGKFGDSLARYPEFVLDFKAPGGCMSDLSLLSPSADPDLFVPNGRVSWMQGDAVLCTGQLQLAAPETNDVCRGSCMPMTCAESTCNGEKYSIPLLKRLKLFLLSN